MEKHFKQKIEGLDSVPPGMNHDREASWSRIEAGLRERRRRKTMLRLLAAASLAIPLVWGAAKLFSPGEEEKDWKELAAEASLDSLMKQGASLSTVMESPPGNVKRKLSQAEKLDIELRIVRKAIEIERERIVKEEGRDGRNQGLEEQETDGWVSLDLSVVGSSTAGTNAYTYTWQDQQSQGLNSGKISTIVSNGTVNRSLSGDKAANFKKTIRDGDAFSNSEKLGAKGLDEVSTLGEGYGHFIENAPMAAAENAFSTFGLDVDVASYGNIRRYLKTQGAMPPTDAVRIEEMVNYFDYHYPKPTGTLPIEMVVESGPCPWNAEAQLVQIGMQAKEVDKSQMAPANLVFLIDVSGSMSEDLQLVKGSMRKLVKELRPQDRVSMVVYAGAAGQVLPSTPGSDKATILAALDRLEAGGSTAGGEGIELAYATALANHRPEVNSRIILCTDGDFNVGPSSNEELEDIVTVMREKDIFLSCLGFGAGNYQDDMMETIADKGNGNYAYIDRQEEADRVFGKELTGTLSTIAKDVKLQVEWNPALVKTYRLVGYENRMLNKEDFANDSIDAGDVGAGHTVTALYEIVLRKPGDQTDPSLQAMNHPGADKSPAVFCGELMRLNMRYKKPTGKTSSLMTWAIPHVPLTAEQTSTNFRWAAAVASFGMLLRQSEYVKDMDYSQLLSLAQSASKPDPDGEKREFMELVKRAQQLSAAATVGR